MGNLKFNAHEVAPQQPFEPLPTGWYEMIFAEAGVERSESAGEMLRAVLEVTDAHPEYTGRKAFCNLCHNHPNDTPRKIARAQLSAICHAIGILDLEDTEQLLGHRLQVRLVAVGPETGKDGKTYDAKNEVRGFKATGDASAAAAPPPEAKRSANAPKAVPAATQSESAPKQPAAGRSAGWKR